MILAIWEVRPVQADPKSSDTYTGGLSFKYDADDTPPEPPPTPADIYQASLSEFSEASEFE